MNTFLQRIIFRYTQASKNFQIVKGKFLIPSKPKRPMTAFMLFSQEVRSKNTGAITEVAKMLGQQWKQLPQEEKKKYQDIYKQNYQKYRAQLQQYESKYVQPLKTVTLNQLMLKKIYKDKQLEGSVTDLIRQVKPQLQKMSPEQRQKIQKELADIKSQRQKVQNQYHIPELQYKTLRAFMMNQAGDKSLSELTEAKRRTLQERYTKYLEKHQKQVIAFAKRFGLTLLELRDVINRHQRRLNREKASKEVGLIQPAAVKTKAVKRTASKTASKTAPKAKTTKAATGAKKSTGAKRVVRKAATKNEGTKTVENTTATTAQTK